MVRPRITGAEINAEINVQINVEINAEINAETNAGPLCLMGDTTGGGIVESRTNIMEPDVIMMTMIGIPHSDLRDDHNAEIETTIAIVVQKANRWWVDLSVWSTIVASVLSGPYILFLSLYRR